MIVALKIAFATALVSDLAAATGGPEAAASINVANLAANVITLAIAIAALLTTPRRAQVKRLEGNTDGFKNALEVSEHHREEQRIMIASLEAKVAAANARHDELRSRCEALEQYTAPQALENLIARQETRDHRLYEVLDRIEARLGTAEQERAAERAP